MADRHPTDFAGGNGIIQTAVKTKKPRKQAISGRFWAGRTYRGRIKDDHKIDVGCGGGQTLYRLAESYPETTLAGIDYSDVSVELSRETNERFISVGRTSIQKASVDELPFNDDVFDKVITVESFYFWPDHDKGLKEILRVLKPGGKLLIICEVYGDAPLSPRERENIQKYTMFNPTRAEYRELMKRNGFREVDIHVR